MEWKASRQAFSPYWPSCAGCKWHWGRLQQGVCVAWGSPLGCLFSAAAGSAMRTLFLAQIVSTGPGWEGDSGLNRRKLVIFAIAVQLASLPFFILAARTSRGDRRSGA